MCGEDGIVTCVYVVQTVTAEVEQLQLFGQQELFWLEMFYVVVGQIHLHDVRWQVRWDAIQTCRGRKVQKNQAFSFHDTEIKRANLKDKMHLQSCMLTEARGRKHFRHFD